MYNEERFFTPKLLNVLQPLQVQWLLHLQPASILINSIFPTQREFRVFPTSLRIAINS